MDLITWTPERVEQLTQLFEEGLPTAEIGRRLGLTKNAVIGKLHRIALSPRISSPPAPAGRKSTAGGGSPAAFEAPHRAVDAVEGQREHAVFGNAADHSDAGRAGPMFLRHRVEPHRPRIGVEEAA